VRTIRDAEDRNKESNKEYWLKPSKSHGDHGLHTMKRVGIPIQLRLCGIGLGVNHDLFFFAFRQSRIDAVIENLNPCVRLCDYTGKGTEGVATSHKGFLTRNDFRLACESSIIVASHDFQRDSASISTLIQIVLQQFWCLAARRPSIDCSESENIQHAISADSNQLVSVHAEGDRV
jgi:hypothetical protein